MTLKTCIRALIIAGLFAVLGPSVSAAQAATLGFDPSSIKVKVGETFDVNIVVDTGTAEALGVDALFTFEGDILEGVKISEGTFLTVNHKEFKPGAAYTVGLVNSPGEAVTGKGTLATVTFKAKKAGTATLVYTCELNDTRESNILGNSTDSPDLIDCSANGKATVVVSGGTSTGGGGSTATGSGSTLPKTGIFDHFEWYVMAGGALVIVGFVARRFL